MKRKIEIFCTLGPKSLNKKFLNFTKGKITLVRLNLSHIDISNLEKTISFIRHETNVPICIDTEGAQIRTKVKKRKKIKKGKRFKFFINEKDSLYPIEVFDQIDVGNKLLIGFESLTAIVTKKTNNYFECTATSEGYLENNKGVYVANKKIKLNYLTPKDLEAIKIAKQLKIKNFALSFTNSLNDIVKFSHLLPKSRKIYKFESKSALKNWKELLNSGNEFLIDRGDLSKETSIEEIPFYQRKIVKDVKSKNKKVFIATNFLESMIKNPEPTRAEANDIYSSLEMGASGLVLAAETAIGDYPFRSVSFLKKIIKNFRKTKLNF